MDPPLNGAGNSAAEVSKDSEILNTFLSVFTVKASPQESLTQKTMKKVWGKGAFPLFEEVQARDHLVEFGPTDLSNDGICPRVLRKLAQYHCYGTLIFERSWQSGEGSGDWKKVNVTSVFRKGEKEEQASQSHLEQHILEAILIMQKARR